MSGAKKRRQHPFRPPQGFPVGPSLQPKYRSPVGESQARAIGKSVPDPFLRGAAGGAGKRGIEQETTITSGPIKGTELACASECDLEGASLCGFAELGYSVAGWHALRRASLVWQHASKARCRYGRRMRRPYSAIDKAPCPSLKLWACHPPPQCAGCSIALLALQESHQRRGQMVTHLVFLVHYHVGPRMDELPAVDVIAGPGHDQGPGRMMADQCDQPARSLGRGHGDEHRRGAMEPRVLEHFDQLAQASAEAISNIRPQPTGCTTWPTPCPP